MRTRTCVTRSYAFSPSERLCMLQMMSLEMATASLGADRSPEAAHKTFQQQSAWADVRAQYLDEGRLETERERLQVWHTVKCQT